MESPSSLRYLESQRLVAAQTPPVMGHRAEENFPAVPSSLEGWDDGANNLLDLILGGNSQLTLHMEFVVFSFSGQSFFTTHFTNLIFTVF
jgi:hypothetical protein